MLLEGAGGTDACCGSRQSWYLLSTAPPTHTPRHSTELQAISVPGCRVVSPLGATPCLLPLPASGTLPLLPTEPSGNSYTDTMDSDGGTSVVLYLNSLPMPEGNDYLIQQVAEAP